MTLPLRWLRNDAGNTTVLFALTSVPLMIVAGAAIDYNRINEVKGDVQAAMDGAVLAAGAKSTFDKRVAETFLARNLPQGDVTLKSASFKTEGSNIITGTAMVTVPLGLMSLAGKSEQTITVTSKVQAVNPVKISKVDFQISNAQGAYDKEVYWFTKDKDGNVLTKELVLSYDYTYTTSGGTKAFSPPVTTPKSVTVGTYDKVGQMVVVYEDPSYRGKKIRPKELWSDDPTAPTWIKTKGECTDPAGQTQNWEDGGDSNYMDFVFTLKCTTSTSSKRQVRLVK